MPIPFLIISSVQACKFSNRAEPCNCFRQPNVERRRGVSWSTVRHLCLLLNMNAYLRCLLRDLICPFVLSRFRKSRPLKQISLNCSEVLFSPIRKCQVLLPEGTKGLLKMTYVHWELESSNPFLFYSYSVTIKYITVVFQIGIFNHLMSHNVCRRESIVMS